jgi:manganese efflux pump family protein
MNLLELFILAFVLSMDSFAVSISCGIRCLSARKFVKVAATLAIFQAIFPLFGWLVGSAFSSLLQEIDHWVAFALLLFIGIRMLAESRKRQEDTKFDIQKTRVLLLLAVATSIDALVVGIGFGLLKVNILLACLIIGAVTFAASMSGGFLGNKGGRYLGVYAEVAGGIVLIALGTKILFEHL